MHGFRSEVTVLCTASGENTSYRPPTRRRKSWSPTIAEASPQADEGTVVLEASPVPYQTALVREA